MTILAGIALSCFTIQAQQYDVLDIVKADIRKVYGMEGPHRLDEFGTLSKAPKGFKPFYISHYGRHGSRYAWNPDTYTLLHEVFTKAAENGILTPYGQDFAQRYQDFYLTPYINTGDLTPLGFDQHLAIGTFTYQQFPQVFKGRKKVDALSSVGQRCIVSMGAFTLGLQSGNPKLIMNLQSLHTGMAIIAPPSVDEHLLKHFKGENDQIALESPESFFTRTCALQELMDKLFTDSSFMSEEEKLNFIFELWSLYCGYHNYEPRPIFDDLFTQDQLLKYWEADSYISVRWDSSHRYCVIPLLEDIIEKAEASFKDPNQAAHLRFGHDYILASLATLIDINGMGMVPDTPEEAKYWFQSYNIPMAATLLFVFYKNKKGDIIFKPVLNENDAFLPQLTPVQDNFYRWADFRAWADKLMQEHPEE